MMQRSRFLSSSLALSLSLMLGAAAASAHDANPAAAPTVTPGAAVDPASATAPAAANPATPATPAPDPLVKTDTKLGTGAEAMAGSTIRVHYSGWLYKPLAKNQRGRMFDSSVTRGEPLEFVLGVGKVIKGWDQGVLGMKVGGKRTLIIPSYLAYGKRGMPPAMIPGDADLLFEVELVSVK